MGNVKVDDSLVQIAAAVDNEIAQAIHNLDFALYYKVLANRPWRVRMDYGDGADSEVFECQYASELENFLIDDYFNREHECARCNRYVMGSQFVDIQDGPDLDTTHVTMLSDWKEVYHGRAGFVRVCEDCADDIAKNVEELQTDGELEDYINLSQFDGEFVRSVW